VSSYVDNVGPVILDSARKHGVGDDDILHAYQHPIRVLLLEELTMLIGPDSASRLLEVGVTTAQGVDLVVHAMPARAKFLR
jgi:hypothetical protein